MFGLYRDTCDVWFRVGTRSLIALHSTSGGPIGYLRCPTGHLDVVRKPRVAGAHGAGRIAYQRGRPASECDPCRLEASPAPGSVAGRVGVTETRRVR